MRHIKSTYPSNYLFIALAAAALMSILAGFGGYQYYTLSKEFEQARQDFSSTTAAFEARVADLEGRLAQAQDESVRLGTDLATEIGKSEQLDSQLQNASQTVTILQKLTTIDPQLLQKYSKIFFLSENYTPTALIDISANEYTYANGKTVQFLANAWPYLQKLLAAAASDGVQLRVLSGYRSFGEQSSLKSSYKVVYGTGANQFSADQGYSEHQLGTAIDFTTPTLGSVLDGLDETAGYSWLLANAHRYGFTLSYPKGNAYYQFEPWHWRFVGITLATRLFEDRQYFYDLDQRIIDQYRIKLFD